MKTIWKFLKIAVLVAIAIPAIGFILLMWSIDTSSTGAGNFSSQQNEARIRCMGAIRDALRDPGSVQWVDRASWPAGRTEAGTIVVTATYSATNAFGGRIREQRRCEVRLSENGRGVVIAME